MQSVSAEEAYLKDDRNSTIDDVTSQLPVTDGKSTKNGTLLEKLGVRLDHEDVGMNTSSDDKSTFEKPPLFENQVADEARSKKGGGGGGKMNVGYFIGLMKTVIATYLIAGIKMLVLKSLVVAKTALLVSALLLIAKIFKHEHHEEPGYIEVEHHGSAPIPAYEYPPSGYSHSGYGKSFDPTGSGSALSYSTVDAPTSNSSASRPASRRRGESRKRPTLLTITRFSKKEDNGII
ncbi:unnamed protein product [Acanthoscelides obtectus]|uniref:Uncharacterized protein n=1 Tax=Acanthoscelides obtectus TaxID=200917 RepID=A0A9P0KKJ8_ACAOB|nr:unnamed protein product [Acanthoscelides obtectus]CAK1648167.1 hypothetical protein AOBTE_LOCUS15580 [Acanthoscelides obtectus]